MGETKWTRHFPVSNHPATIHWDETGRSADVDFLATDGTPVILTMTALSLERLRVDIGGALSQRPKSNRPR
jgi:hypothetical protein